QSAGVLNLRATLQHRLGKIADLSDQSDCRSEGDRMPQRNLVKEDQLAQGTGSDRGDYASDRALDGLARTHLWREFVFAQRTSHVVRAGVRKHDHRKEHREQL